MTQPNLNSQIAKDMALLCDVVYRSNTDGSPNEAVITQLLATRGGFTQVKGISKHGSQAIVVEHKDYFAIAFRGTDMANGFGEAWGDWQKNINARVRKGTHHGFATAYEDVCNEVVEALRQMRGGESPLSRPLYVAGHSLGGAMALIYADRNHTIQPKGVYTFGAPRVFGVRKAKQIRARLGPKHWRFVNHCDVVPRLPSGWHYRHVGVLLYLTSKARVVRSPSRLRLVKDVMLGGLRGLLRAKVEGVSDHNIGDYRSALRRSLW